MTFAASSSFRTRRPFPVDRGGIRAAWENPTLHRMGIPPVIDITGCGTPAPERPRQVDPALDIMLAASNGWLYRAVRHDRGLSRCARGASGRVSRSPL